MTDSDETVRSAPFTYDTAIRHELFESQDVTHSSPADNGGYVHMALLNVNLWREILEQELRERAVPFSQLAWPIDFGLLPRIDITVGFQSDIDDQTNRIETLIDIINSFFEAIQDRLQPAQYFQRFTFVLAGNVQALALVDLQPDNSYSTRLLQIELVQEDTNLLRALVYERHYQTGLLTLTHSDTNPARRLLGQNTVFVFLTSLANHYLQTPPSARSEPALFEAVQRLATEPLQTDSDAMTRLLRMYFVAPSYISFIARLVREAQRIGRRAASVAPDELLEEITNRAAMLADDAPEGITSSDIFSILSSLNTEFALRANLFALAPAAPQEERLSQVDPKRRRAEFLMMTDATIDRLASFFGSKTAPAQPGAVVTL